MRVVVSTKGEKTNDHWVRLLFRVAFRFEFMNFVNLDPVVRAASAASLHVVECLDCFLGEGWPRCQPNGLGQIFKPR